MSFLHIMIRIRSFLRKWHTTVIPQTGYVHRTSYGLFLYTLSSYWNQIMNMTGNCSKFIGKHIIAQYLQGENHIIFISLLIYDLQSEDWINTYYMLKFFLKARRPPKMSNEMKCTNEKMTWNTQNTTLSSYVSKVIVGHTICGQGTGISTLDHSATTSCRTNNHKNL